MIRVAIVLLILITSNSYALPKAPFDALKSKVEPPLSSTFLEYDYEGIVKLSNCSGSIIRFKNQSIDDHAIVLTNGHCLGGRF